MTNDTVKIEIDGKPIEAHKGQMLIEVTDKHDIYIPRFCYHQKLTVAANCRMCLVDVEKAPKPLPACATPVMDGMKVKTKSERAISAQKAVMEFLLINHPLDCPICDQGGECELQDLAMGYGRDISRYQEKKRVVKDKNIGPLVQTDMTRCIHCTRCVRFGQEIAGLQELGATGRGEHMEIGTYIEKSMVSEMSGNVIDICPVGALTSKPFRFSARTWEMIQREGIAPHDSVGSNIHFHIKDDVVKRVVPAENELINEVWLSDRDRFSYEGLYSPERLTSPMIRQNGEWRTVDWEIALQTACDGLQRIINLNGPDRVGTLVSASSTLEELYLLQKFMRGIGSNNIDHRLRQIDFNDQETMPVFPWLGQSITDLDQLQAALLIGSYTRKEQPLLNHRLRKASMRGSHVMVINPYDFEFNLNVTEKIITPYTGLVTELAAVLKALTGVVTDKPDPSVFQIIETVDTNETHRSIAKHLLESDNSTVLLGNLAFSHPRFSSLRILASTIARLSHSKLGYLTEAANSTGAWLAGVLPHRLPGAKPVNRAGLNAHDMLVEPLNAYVTLGIEPEIDCWNSRHALHAMKTAECVIAMTAYVTETMKDYADVLLPIALFAETPGTYVNTEGRFQSFTAAVSPPGEARPAWKVLRVLGNRFNLPTFEYSTTEEILDELSQQTGVIEPDNSFESNSVITLQKDNNNVQCFAYVPMNAIDPLTRRASALQQTIDIADGSVHLPTELARQLGIEEGNNVRIEQEEGSVILPAVIDDRLPERSALIHAGQSCQKELDGWYSDITLVKV